VKSIVLVFGTRPEAIKMLPVYMELKKSSFFNVRIILTAQHREMLDQVMTFFGVKADADLNVMKANQSLTELTKNILLGLNREFQKEKPNLVLVHGDTTTTMAASLAAFYERIPVAHIEAGLRTFDLSSPFPEEANRQLTGVLSSIHFSPTEGSKQNLLREGKNKESIVVTGNTVIDALLWSVEKVKSSLKIYPVKKVIEKFPNKRILLVTGHRRENFGQGFLDICEALKKIANANDVHIIYPVHLNPNVKEPVYKILKDVLNVSLIEPLDYEEFLYLMDQCYLLITDSGGVQEEAPSLGKPVLVMRETTERPEAVEHGTVKLVGTDIDKIVANVEQLLNDKTAYEKMSAAHNPYGDGKASERIRLYLENDYFKV
jgi:UDP-N-acetylglucosamine 2-epimerase (non-hydrolysing)